MRKAGNWLSSYLKYTRHLESTHVLHFWAGVATIAAALRGKVWIDMGYWKWKPNFFIFFVAPPGIAAKSTTIGVGRGLLEGIEGVHFGPDSATWQAITASLLDSEERIVYADGSEERMSAITLTVSELGTLLDPQNRELVDVLTDLWDGKDRPWQRSTRMDGHSTIQNPWVHLIAGTTPAWMAKNFPEVAIGGGLTSRTIFVYEDKKRHYAAYPGHRIDQEDVSLMLNLRADLERMAELAGPYTITDEALEWGELWYKDLWENPPEHLLSERMGGWRARKQTHVHKLAMVMSAAERDDLIITKEHLVKSAALITALEQQIPRVFAKVSDDPRARHTTTVMELIRMRGKQGITKEMAWRQVMSYMPWQAFEEAITAGLHAKYFTLSQGSDGKIMIAATDMLITSTGESHDKQTEYASVHSRG